MFANIVNNKKYF